MPKKKAAESSSDSDSGPEDVSILLKILFRIYFFKFPYFVSVSIVNCKIIYFFLLYLQRTPVKKAKKDSDGSTTFELTNNRRLTVRSFKGKVYVDIREFYLKDGDWLPGKKGIALSPEQWNSLLEKSDDIGKAIKET